MLARAIAQEPEILILDEPTSYLDIRYKLEFLSLLQKLAKEKKLTVIMSLHELDLAERISDRLLCLKGEYIECIGTAREVFRPGYISSLYEIKEGSFDERYGRVELERVEGKPVYFVIAGGGSSSSTFRRLQRMSVPFAAGILWGNDLDTPVAKSLAVKSFITAAFEPVKREMVEEAKIVIDECEGVICTVEKFGKYNCENKELLRYAKEQGKLIEGEKIWQR